MSLTENFHFDKNASIAFDWSNANGISPTPYTWTSKAHTSLRRTLTQAKRARIEGVFSSYSCSCFSFCRYIHFREIYSLSWNMFTKDEFDMFSLCSNSIYCRHAPIRYEINPFRFWHISPLARNAKAYRVRQHISSLYISPLVRYAKHIENPARDLSRCVILR